MFFLLYKHTDDGVFDDFPKISHHFPKIPQNCSEGKTNVPEQFPKIPEDVRRLPRTFEGDPKMSQWYTNEFKYNLNTERSYKRQGHSPLKHFVGFLCNGGKSE